MIPLPFFPSENLPLTLDSWTSKLSGLQWHIFGTGTCLFYNIFINTQHMQIQVFGKDEVIIVTFEVNALSPDLV